MAPFRWPSTQHDIMLAREVASRNPKTPQHWEDIAAILRKEFSTTDKAVDIKGRACRERIDRLLEKYRQEDNKSLKRSGSEEEFTELNQLLEDISTYRRDMEELKVKEKELKKKKDSLDRQKGIEMRQAAMQGMSKRKQESSSESNSSSEDSDAIDSRSSSGGKKGSKGKAPRRRGTKLSAVQLLEKKYERKANLKEQELQLRAKELELQKQKYEDEAAERKQKLELELEERRVFLNLLKDKL